jgi:hypothetical protein
MGLRLPGDVGKPDEGELHVRFDRGPLAKRTYGEMEQAPEGNHRD